MCTAYAVRQHRLSVLVKVFSRSRARTGAAGSARSQPERSSTERGAPDGAVAARSRPIRRPGGLRLEVGQTRSCIPRSDAPGRTSGSRRIHVPHDRRPTAPTSSTLRPTHHAAREPSAEPADASGMPDRPLCRSPDRHARGVVAGRESCYESIPTIAKKCEYATEYRDVSVSGSPPVRSPVHGRGPGGQGLVRVTLTGSQSSATHRSHSTPYADHS